MSKPESTENESASARIDQQFAELGDWRGETLRRVRDLIHEEDPDVVEDGEVGQGDQPRHARCGSTTASSAPVRPTRPS